MSDPVTSARARRARDPRSPTIWCGIPELPYAIRNSEFGIRNSEIEIRNPEKRQIMVRSAAFRSNPRKHWPESGSQEIFMVRYFPP